MAEAGVDTVFEFLLARLDVGDVADDADHALDRAVSDPRNLVGVERPPRAFDHKMLLDRTPFAELERGGWAVHRAAGEAAVLAEAVTASLNQSPGRRGT